MSQPKSNSFDGILQNCTFRQIKWSTRKKDRYTCLIKNIDLTRVFVFGAHVDKNLNRHVTGLKIEQCKIDSIPKVFARNFPNLTGLSITGCGLKSINKEDLEGKKKYLIKIKNVFFLSKADFY